MRHKRSPLTHGLSRTNSCASAGVANADTKWIVKLGDLNQVFDGDWEQADATAREQLLNLAFDDQLYGSAQAWGIALDLELTDSLPDSYLPPMFCGSLHPAGSDANTAPVKPTLAAYPNPAKDRVVLAFPEWAADGTIQVFDAQGHLQATPTLSGQHAFTELSLSGWAEGIYLARLVFDGIAVGECKFTVAK